MTFDIAWSPNCTDDRCYDAKALAEVTDFLVIMAYDEQSQIFGPCIGMGNSPFNKTVSGRT